MNEEYPPNWELPTLGFLKNEPLLGGIPNKQGAMIGMCVFILFMMMNKTLGIFIALPLAFMIGGAIFGIARWKYARNPNWYALMTSHVYPADRWLGG